MKWPLGDPKMSFDSIVLTVIDDPLSNNYWVQILLQSGQAQAHGVSLKFLILCHNNYMAIEPKSNSHKKQMGSNVITVCRSLDFCVHTAMKSKPKIRKKGPLNSF